MKNISLTKGLLTPLREVKIPKKSGYANANNVMKLETDTLQLFSKDQAALSRFQKTFDEFTQNPQFEFFRGPLNAMADQAGLRMTVDFLPKKPDKLVVTIFDKKYVPDSEFFTEFANAFKEPKKFFAHMKNFVNGWVDSYCLVGTDFRRKIIIDPKNNYVSDIKNAIYELAEGKELSKHTQV